MINIISEDIKFNTTLKQFPNAKANVSIFGTQSSGKSTLMNQAFGCNFPTLNSKKKRQRCTRGVWYQNIKELDLNIIDTQGFDSIERHQQDRIIQKQIALFCLAISDVIIINIWMTQIGRYEGSQNHILKSIIKMSSKITKPSTKTIIFAVKDCTQDADRGILKQYLIENFQKLLQQQANNKNKNKFDIQFLFLDHFIYALEQYKTQAKKLPSLIKIRKSNLNMFSPQQRIIYLSSIWEKVISSQNEIDLKSQQQALRLYVCCRLRKQIIEKLIEKLEQILHLIHLKSYQRYLQNYIKLCVKMFKDQKPLYLNQKNYQYQIELLESQASYICSQYFTKKLLPQLEQRIIDQEIQKPLSKVYDSPKLQKTINQRKKDILLKYINIVQGHKQQKVLIRMFTERVNQSCLKYQRQISFMYNKFQSMLQENFNQEMDRQVQKLVYDPDKITSIIQRTCKIFQYNDWEINYQETWEKVVHRVIHTKLPQKIHLLSQSFNFNAFDPDKSQKIISQHKKLETKMEQFCRGILTYLDENANTVHIEDRIRQKIQASLQRCLENQAKRFHFSLWMTIIYLGLLYGQFLLLISLFPLKKRQIANLGTLYIAIIVALIGWQIYKSQTKNNNSKK